MLHIKILLITLFLTTVLFGESVAVITAIKGKVNIADLNGTREAFLGEKLNASDKVVITADKSMAQIIFNDETIVTLGRKSNFYIKKYIYASQDNSSANLKLLKGSIRVITGKIGKMAPQRFKVATKNATIGVRGTNFSVLDGEDKVQQVYCTYGAVDVSTPEKSVEVNKNYIYTKSPSGDSEKKSFSAQKLASLNSASFLNEDDLNYAHSKDTSTIQKLYLMDNITEDRRHVVKQRLDDVVKDGTRLY